MSIPSDNGDSFEVTPQRLRDTAPLFHKASQDTADLVHNLNTAAQQLIAEMASELHKSPTALQHLCDRWHTSMNSLSYALDKVGGNLDAAAGGYEHTDNKVSQSFTPHTHRGFDQ